MSNVHELKGRTSPEMMELKKTSAILQQRQRNSKIIDLSQGHPNGPVEKVKKQLGASLKKEEILEMGKYKSDVVTNQFLAAILHYFVEQGVDLAALVQASPSYYEERKITSWKQDKIELERLIAEIKKGKKIESYSEAELRDIKKILDNLSIVSGAENSRAALTRVSEILPGEYVLSAQGFYHSLADLPERTGKKWALLNTEKNPNYRLTAESIEAWIRANGRSKIAYLLIIDPANPTGAVLSAEEKQKIANVCRKYKLPVVEDMIYSGVVMPGKKSVPMSNFYPENTVEISSLTKLYGLPGLRLGWVAGHPRMMVKVRERTRGDTGFLATPLCKWAAMAVSQTSQKDREENNRRYHERIQHVRKKIAAIDSELQKNFPSSEPYLTTNEPEGGFFMLLRMPALKGKYISYEKENGETIRKQVEGSVDLSEFFVNTPNGVRMPSTTATGVPNEKCELRISAGDNDIKQLDQACARIKESIAELLRNQEKYKAEHDRRAPKKPPEAPSRWQHHLQVEFARAASPSRH